VRIIRGFLKSRRFSPPKKFPSRPTTDFAKEGLFNVLENSVSLYNLEILDLCAGTGNISYEFASREAGKITAVEHNFNCVRFIQQMTREHKLEGAISVFKSDVRDFVRRTEKKFDLIFLDPPYEVEFYHELVNTIFERNVLKENGLLVVEHGKKTSFSEFPTFEKEKVYGNVHFSFLKHPAYENA
jgi:16S rRNA (guanine(966)-N(2))-methyltransferase RsmD